MKLPPFLQALLERIGFRKKPVCQYKMSAVKLMEIEPSLVARVFSSDMSFFKVYLLDFDIVEYYRFLRNISGHLKNRVLIDPAGLPDHPILRHPKNLFIDKKKRLYLEIEDNFKEFQITANEFLKLYSEVQQQEQKTFVEEKLLFLFHYIATNLTQIEKALTHEFQPPRRKIFGKFIRRKT